MTTYNVVKAINNSVNNEYLGQERYYVVFADGPRVGTRENIVGYKNRKSAVGRISDLKKKEIAATTAIVDKDRHNEMSRDDQPTSAVVVADHFTIASHDEAPIGLLAINASGDVVPRPNALKLATSSAYGKSKPFTITSDPGEPPHPVFDNNVRRQVGCYPAISKRAYQR